MLKQMTPKQLDEWMAAASLDNLLCDPFTGHGLPTPEEKDPDAPVAASPNQAAQMFKALAGK